MFFSFLENDYFLVTTLKIIMYSTWLEETQWQVIKKILNLQERKRKYDLREMWNAIFYVVKQSVFSRCANIVQTY